VVAPSRCRVGDITKVPIPFLYITAAFPFNTAKTVIQPCILFQNCTTTMHSLSYCMCHFNIAITYAKQQIMHVSHATLCSNHYLSNDTFLRVWVPFLPIQASPLSGCSLNHSPDSVHVKYLCISINVLIVDILITSPDGSHLIQ